jgi:hypothetical protein
LPSTPPTALKVVEAVTKVRKIIGNTYPNEAPPGTRPRRLRPPDQGPLASMAMDYEH